MKRSALLELKVLAKRQLLNYRRNKAKIAAHDLSAREEEEAQGWICAVDGARRLLRESMPEKEKAVSRLFGLDHPIPRYQPVRERIIKLSMDYCVAESTMYGWREDMINLVLMAGAEGGLLCPFGLKKQSAGEEEAEKAPLTGPRGE